MSLLRLLTTGRSLIEFKDTPGTYQMTSQRLLPHFGPARNPFSSKAASNAVPEAEMAAVMQSKVQDLKASSDGGERGGSQASWLGATSLLKTWKAKCDGLFKRAGGRAAKPAIPRFTRQPVQGELSLDKVKVVRNDLSDADLEIVPARRSATQGSSASAARSEMTTSVAAGLWGRVANRIFGAGKA